MANYEELFAGKMDWAKPFQRTGKFPIDRSEMFSSYADAVKYAAGNKEDPDSRGLCGTSYVGQNITVVENDVVTVYKIEANRTLKEVGSATLGDGKSIDLDDGNVLSLKNFGKKYYRYVPATESAEATYELVEDGTFPAGLQPKTRLAEDGTIELAWYEPSSTTVEGLSEQMASLTETVNTMQGTVSSNTQALEGKVDKVGNKQLSTEDYTTQEKEKLAGIASGAQANVLEGISVNGEQKTPNNKLIDLTIPTKLTDLTNDASFIDNTVNNLTNYYLKTETYTKTEVDNLLGQISTMDALVVDALPTENISTSTIYLVPKPDSETDDVYDEYLYISSTSKFEKIGNTSLDLSNYLQKNGDASQVTATFTEATDKVLPASGESLSIILGKIVKYLNSLKDVAFTGSYNDLTDKPDVNKTNRIELTLTAGQTSVSSGAIIGTLASWYAYDAVSNEQLLCDATITTANQDDGSSTFTLEVSIDSAYNNDIKIVISAVQ